MATPGDITPEQLERLRELNKLKEEGIALSHAEKSELGDIKAAYNTLGGVLTKNRDVIEDIVRHRREESSVLREKIKLLEDERATYLAMEDSFDARRAAHESDIEALKTKIAFEQEQLRLRTSMSDDDRRDAQERIKEAQDLIVARNKEVESLGRAEATISNVFDAQHGVALAAHDFRAALDAGQGSAFALSKAIEASSGMFDSMLGSIKEVVMEVHTAEYAFKRAFQMPDELNDRLVENYKSLNQFGVSMEEASEATGELINNVTDFTMASAAQQDSLVKTTALLNEVGVAAGDVAAGVQVSMKMFGQSIGEAENTSLELAATARALQVVPGQLAAEYAKMGPELAKFGQEGTKTFKELARIQKLTGMEMGKVLQIAGKFDTFEDAAESTGKLNAALGGNFVNAMDMLMDTDPVSRFDTIRGAIEDAGLSFDTMSYYQKQFYTEALGLSDVGDLALMLSGRTDLMTDATNKSAESYEEQAERAKAVQDIQDKMRIILAENAESFIHLAEVAAGFLTFLADNMWIIKTLTVVLGTLKVAQIGLTIANTSLAVTEAALNKTFSAGATARTKQVFAIMAIAAALILLGKAFMIESPSKLVLTVIAFAGALRLMSAVAGPAIPTLNALAGTLYNLGAGLMTVAIPFAIIGGIVAIVALSIGIMAKGFAALFEAINIEKAVAFGAFVAALALGAPYMVVAGIGLAAMAVGMGALAFSLAFIKTKDLVAIATFSESLASVSAGQLLEVAIAMRAVAKAMDDIPVKKSITLRTVLDRVTASATAVRAAGGAQAFGAAAGGGGALGQGGGGTASRPRPQNVTVKLELDGKVLAEKVVKIMGEEYKPIFAGQG